MRTKDALMMLHWPSEELGKHWEAVFCFKPKPPRSDMEGCFDYLRRLGSEVRNQLAEDLANKIDHS
jgi:hypothetical protein